MSSLRLNNNLFTSILYNNSSGTTANLTFTKSISNYNSIEIIYGCDGRIYNTGKIYLPYSGNIETDVIHTNENNTIFIYTSTWKLEQNKISFLYASNKALSSDNDVIGYGNSSYVRIYKVIGYK